MDPKQLNKFGWPGESQFIATVILSRTTKSGILTFEEVKYF
jgi:hypothetical protein